jgi:hypothetical protein
MFRAAPRPAGVWNSVSDDGLIGSLLRFAKASRARLTARPGQISGKK